MPITFIPVNAGYVIGRRPLGFSLPNRMFARQMPGYSDPLVRTCNSKEAIHSNSTHRHQGLEDRCVAPQRSWARSLATWYEDDLPPGSRPQVSLSNGKCNQTIRVRGSNATRYPTNGTRVDDSVDELLHASCKFQIHNVAHALQKQENTEIANQSAMKCFQRLARQRTHLSISVLSHGKYNHIRLLRCSYGVGDGRIAQRVPVDVDATQIGDGCRLTALSDQVLDTVEDGGTVREIRIG